MNLESETPIWITTGPNKGKDLAAMVKQKNGFLLVRAALKVLFKRQELIEGMLSPKKDNNRGKNAASTSASQVEEIELYRKDLSPQR